MAVICLEYRPKNGRYSRYLDQMYNWYRCIWTQLWIQTGRYLRYHCNSNGSYEKLKKVCEFGTWWFGGGKDATVQWGGGMVGGGGRLNVWGTSPRPGGGTDIPPVRKQKQMECGVAFTSTISLIYIDKFKSISTLIHIDWFTSTLMWIIKTRLTSK